ncbi:MAG TPA: hypothetical protein VN837_22515 [Chloroflexota bacterium]|nr:hypothetical protein [Chloroflexota bacterium]
MDFIERWFHVSPDGGNGSLEVLYVVAILAVIAMVLCRRHLGNVVARVAPNLGKHNSEDR